MSCCPSSINGLTCFSPMGRSSSYDQAGPFPFIRCDWDQNKHFSRSEVDFPWQLTCWSSWYHVCVKEVISMSLKLMSLLCPGRHNNFRVPLTLSTCKAEGNQLKQSSSLQSLTMPDIEPAQTELFFAIFGYARHRRWSQKPVGSLPHLPYCREAMGMGLCCQTLHCRNGKRVWEGITDAKEK